MIGLAFILLSKVGTPVGGFGALIVAFLVVYWVYKKDHPSSTHYNINITEGSPDRGSAEGDSGL